MNIKAGSPRELVESIISIFPAFEKKWDKGEGLGYDDCQYTYHSVFTALSPLCNEYLCEADEKSVKRFCELINHAVSKGGDLENAVSTCILEHASQIGIQKIIKPYLSEEARGELR